MVRTDLIDALLPNASDAVLQRARRVTTYLRLLTDDGRPRQPSPVSINLERAAEEFERSSRQRRTRALLELARRYLRVLLGRDSFVELGEPEPQDPEPWSVLASLRAEDPSLPCVPRPGESAIEVAERMLAALRESDPHATRLSGAWLARAGQGPAAGAEASARLEASEPDLAARARRIQIECHLDRGAVGRAAEALEGIPRAWFQHDDRLSWLRVWVHLFLGDEVAARRHAKGRSPYEGPVPRAVLELRERRPEWVRWLAGRPGGVALSNPIVEPARQREEFGALFLGVFSFCPESGVQPVALDIAPGLRERFDEALFERADAHAVPGELEHHVVVDAEVHVAHRGDAASERALRGALDPDRTRAAAVAPILDQEREVIGWLRLETAHHLLPDRARLQGLAAAWQPALIRSSARISLPVTSRAAERGSVCAETFTQWVSELTMKTAQRRWWGFVVGPNEIVEVAAGGGALQGSEAGQRRGLRRAIASRGTVVFRERDSALSVSAAAASGIVIPLVLRDRVSGLFVAESARRRDFRAADVARFSEAARVFAPRLRLAEFRDWHCVRFGADVVLDCDDTPFGRRALDFIAAGRARSSVAISGSPGCGKEVLARWLHFEGGQPDAPFTVLPAGAINARPERLTRALEELDSVLGSLVIDDVTVLDRAGQVRLLDRWVAAEAKTCTEALSGRRRIIVTASCGLGEAIERNLVLPELGRRMQRLELDIPPLSRRREEIPDLIEVLARRFAGEEGLTPPRFPDETVAWLWRQNWPGNVRELGHWIYKLTLLHSGRSVAPEVLEALAERFGLSFQRRIPSRHPDREDLRAALRTTLTRRGTLNKTRAALYLGWDPDTLVARLRDCGWPDDFSIERSGAVAPE